MLGAISDPDGSISTIIPHLSLLVPFLKAELGSDNEIVRSTTLWSLSKFSEWIS